MFTGTNRQIVKNSASDNLCELELGWYSKVMAIETLEDSRGVDRASLRERLRLTPAERVERLVHDVRVWKEILESAESHR